MNDRSDDRFVQFPSHAFPGIYVNQKNSLRSDSDRGFVKLGNATSTKRRRNALWDSRLGSPKKVKSITIPALILAIRKSSVNRLIHIRNVNSYTYIDL